MYIPPQYQADWLQLEQLIKQYPLATVVTVDDGKIIANHIPFLLHTENGKRYLRAHVAKKNHQVPSLRDNSHVLVIFSLPDAYVTPSFYPKKNVTHKFVPTWVFGSAHIYGKLRIVDDFDFVRQQLVDFTNQNESHRNEPWAVTDAPEQYLKIMQRAITGLEIEIEESQCKYKFEQKLGADNVAGVIKGFKKEGNDVVAGLVESSNAG